MNLQGYFNQTYTVEFEVPGDLDGVTLSPAISATIPAAKDPQSMYRPEVVTDDNSDGNLGLIDPDYVVSEDGEDKLGARGNRYIPWIWIESSAPGAADASLDIVDAVDGSVAVQKNITSLMGVTTFYRDRGILVPQGSLIRINGFTGGAKVRLHIAGLTDAGLIEVQKAICLCDASNGGNGGDVFKFRSSGAGTIPLPAGTFTELPLAAPSLDVTGWVPGVPGGITVPRDGTYRFDGTAAIVGPAGPGTFIGVFFVNGVIVLDPLSLQVVAAGEAFSVQIERIIDGLSAGDVVSFGIFSPVAATFIGFLSIFEAVEVL